MASIMRLHLQYRLWISDLNADINTLRIFDDYLGELKAKNANEDFTRQLNSYNEQFMQLRKESDALRHELHLTKMKLGALAKTSDQVKDNEEGINYKGDKERYEAYRKKFSEIKNDFKKLEVVK